MLWHFSWFTLLTFVKEFLTVPVRLFQYIGIVGEYAFDFGGVAFEP